MVVGVVQVHNDKDEQDKALESNMEHVGTILKYCRRSGIVMEREGTNSTFEFGYVGNNSLHGSIPCLCHVVGNDSLHHGSNSMLLSWALERFPSF